MQRRSRQRTALETVLSEADGFLTAAQLHEQLTGHGASVSLSTVYRLLHAMDDDGTVEVLPTVEGELRYRRCPMAGRHIHLVCPACGTARNVVDEDLQNRVLDAASTHGFTVQRPTIEITAQCQACPHR